MFDLIALDPATASLIETLVVTGFLLVSGVCVLMLLPWTDREIDEVDGAAKAALASLKDVLLPSLAPEPLPASAGPPSGLPAQVVALRPRPLVREPGQKRAA